MLDLPGSGWQVRLWEHCKPQGHQLCIVQPSTWRWSMALCLNAVAVAGAATATCCCVLAKELALHQAVHSVKPRRTIRAQRRQLQQQRCKLDYQLIAPYNSLHAASVGWLSQQ